MQQSDLRFVVRNRAWFIVSISTGETVGGPYTRSDEAIKARQAAAQEELTAEFERTRRRAGEYARELAGLSGALRETTDAPLVEQ